MDTANMRLDVPVQRLRRREARRYGHGHRFQYSDSTNPIVHQPDRAQQATAATDDRLLEPITTEEYYGVDFNFDRVLAEQVEPLRQRIRDRIQMFDRARLQYEQRQAVLEGSYQLPSTSLNMSVDVSPTLQPFQQSAQVPTEPALYSSPSSTSLFDFPQHHSRRQEHHHRVYVIYCTHCGSFLSDRGMRAVLLLKPHITLFSTDAPPTNCGALYADEDDQPLPDALTQAELIQRTCECLTQSLGCFGCGNTVGYQIISPCTRCTASVAKHQRPANGHRYVFHHNEIVHEERKFHAGEHGLRTDLIRHISSSERAAERERAAAASPNAFAPTDTPTPIDLDSKDARERLLPLTVREQTLRPSSPLPSRFRRGQWGLEEGDTIYWHYLVPGGEVIRPVDPRTRVHTSYCVGR